MIARLAVTVGLHFTALAIHEVGHAVFGVLAGFRLRLLGVGPIGLESQESGLKLRRLPLRAWGPFATMRAESTERLESRLAWLLAGGPLTSLCVGIVCVGASLLPGASRWWLAVGVLNLCVAVASGQPFIATGAGVASDGRRVLDLWRDDPDARAAAALVALDGQAAAGTRPAHWDPTLLRRAMQITKPTAFVLAAAVAAYRHATDTVGIAGAETEFAAVREAYAMAPRWLRGDAAAEIAFRLAWVSGDLPRPDRISAMCEVH